MLIILVIFSSSKLVVNLLKAEGLPEARNDNPRVYVAINLIQSTNVTTTNELKSNVQQGSYTPLFNERFEFDISSVEKTCLRFIVYYVDSFSQGECLGMVEHNLEKLIQEEITLNEEIVCKDIQRITRVMTRAVSMP